jgi:glycerol uptake facilitator-like aquaporin
MKTIVEQLSSFSKDLVSFVPPGLFLVISTAFIEGGKYSKIFRREFLGTMLMIACTFSAGKWIGKESLRIAWSSHMMGVIVADYFGGGPFVNPAVTVSMWSLGKITYTEAYVAIAAQLGGGLVAFPLFHAISAAMEWEPFGGPEFQMGDKFATAEAFLSEFFATILLCFLIYTVNWEFNFGTYHYIIKQSMTAVGIRTLIQCFPTAGPAMNPMLATTWNVFGVGKTFEYPSNFEHYFVYWVAPFIAAVVASVCYGIFNGDKIFGATLPFGPLKKKAVAATTTPSFKKKKT